MTGMVIAVVIAARSSRWNIPGLRREIRAGGD